MHRLRNWLIELIIEADLLALKRRDELIDAELASLRGTGGEDAAARYTQLKDGRLY